jgi:5'-nucleotidase
MHILVTNDDGVRAPGIHVLVEVARRLGQVTVVAPDRERSACSHSMTMREPIRMEKHEHAFGMAYEVNGTPTDCVSVGLEYAMPHGCDLVLSGVNSGPNLGFDVTYSGTASGALEAAIHGLPGIAVSMAPLVTGAPVHYETGKAWLDENLASLALAPWRPLTFLNVNIPNFSDPVELRGMRIVPMGQRVYENRVEFRVDPWGRPYYWQGGVAVLSANQPGTDVQAVNEGFVSVTPISLDWTDSAQLGALRAALRHAG